jgi:hypothetical protein
MTAIVVGKTTFRDSYADGRPLFRVRKDMGNGTYQCISEQDLDYNDVERYFSAEQILAKLGYERRVEAMFRSQDDFWAKQELGSVLHYHNGFGDFVRGEVVLVDGEKKLKPTALVGNWNARELPSRRPNGEIHYPYHANKVVNGGPDAPWQPNESCVYESDVYSRRDEYPDPRVQEPIDLSVPDMTPEEKATAVLERQLDRIRGILEERYRTTAPPQQVLDSIMRVAQGYIR